MTVAPAPTSYQYPYTGRDALSEHGVAASVRITDALPTKQYVTSGRFNTQVDRNTAEILATHSDEILRWLGPRAYDRMELDAEVSKCLTVLKTYVLSDGLDISPAVAKQDELFESAKWIADFVTRSVDNLSFPIRDIFEQQLDAMKYGHKVAEITYEFLEEGDDKGLYYLQHLKVLKQGAVAFVRDKYKNVLGFKVAADASQKTKVIPRSKFFVVTLRGKDADPRGTSLLKAAYHAWHFKMMMWPEYITWLKMCAVPGLIGTTSEINDAKNYVRDSSGNPVQDSAGNFITVPATSQLADALAAMRNASAVAIPAGSTVTTVNQSVSSEPFKTSRDVANEEIEMSLLLQTLATSDSRHNTRAASQIAMTVLDVLVYDIKNVVLEAFKRDVIRQLLEVNKEEISKRLRITEEQVLQLVPKLALGDSERRLWANDVTAITAGYNGGEGWIKESQLPGIHRQVGLEQADPADYEMARKKQELTLKGLEVKAAPTTAPENANG